MVQGGKNSADCGIIVGDSEVLYFRMMRDIPVLRGSATYDCESFLKHTREWQTPPDAVAETVRKMHKDCSAR